VGDMRGAGPLIAALHSRRAPVAVDAGALAEAFNPRTGAFGATRQGAGVYGNWGTTAVQRGDQWASTSHVSNNLTGATTRTMQGSGGGAAAARVGPVGTSGGAKTSSGNVYAGHERRRHPHPGH